jgi:hypothetical protein
MKKIEAIIKKFWKIRPPTKRKGSKIVEFKAAQNSAQVTKITSPL